MIQTRFRWAIGIAILSLHLGISSQASAQNTYWVGPPRLSVDNTPNCGANEILMTVGFRSGCVYIRSLNDDSAFQEIVAKLQLVEARAKVLEENVKTLAAANDALIKRVEALEETQLGEVRKEPLMPQLSQ